MISFLLAEYLIRHWESGRAEAKTEIMASGTETNVTIEGLRASTAYSVDVSGDGRAWAPVRASRARLRAACRQVCRAADRALHRTHALICRVAGRSDVARSLGYWRALRFAPISAGVRRRRRRRSFEWRERFTDSTGTHTLSCGLSRQKSARRTSFRRFSISGSGRSSFASKRRPL